MKTASIFAALAWAVAAAVASSTNADKNIGSAADSCPDGQVISCCNDSRMDSSIGLVSIHTGCVESHSCSGISPSVRMLLIFFIFCAFGIPGLTNRSVVDKLGRSSSATEVCGDREYLNPKCCPGSEDTVSWADQDLKAVALGLLTVFREVLITRPPPTLAKAFYKPRSTGQQLTRAMDSAAS